MSVQGLGEGASYFNITTTNHHQQQQHIQNILAVSNHLDYPRSPVTQTTIPTTNGWIHYNASTSGANVTGGWGAGNASLVSGGGTLGLPAESQACLIVLYTLTTLLSVVGNILVIIVFSCGKFSRTDLRGFLVNLAVADLIMALFCMPFTFTMTMLSNWVFSQPMCPIVLYMQTVSVTASVSTNMAIGVDRFWVVTFPLKSLMTKSRSKVVIGVIWVLALGISSIQLFIGKAQATMVLDGRVIYDCVEEWPHDGYRRAYTFFILVSTYVMPLTILTLTYGIVGWKLWQRTAPGNRDEERDKNQLRSKRKVGGFTCALTCIFHASQCLPVCVYL